MSKIDFRSLNVAVVEDHPRMRDIVAKLLKALGFKRVDIYHDGPSALEAIGVGDDPADLVITDLRMQPMDGIEVVKRLRASSATQKLPIMVLSGHGEQEYVRAAMDAGANLFVSKPIAAADLAQRIGKVMAANDKKSGGPPDSTEMVWL